MMTKTISITKKIVISNETMHPVLSLMEGKWKLKQQHDQNFPVDGKSSKNKY